MAHARDLDDRVATARVEALLNEVFAGIGALAAQVVALYERAGAEGRAPSTTDLAALRPAILAHLRGPGPALAGTGVIMAPELLADEPRWLEWLRLPLGSSEPCPLSVDLDPHSVAGYEYTSTEWFSAPRRTGRRVVVGPYVDYAGTDEYILTFAEPIRSGERFLGVAAADIRATDFEQSMLPVLDATAPRSALVNGFGRVIASNSPDTLLGLLAPEARQECALPRGDAWADCDGLPWSLRTV
ncbi:cache domain-containing protein [Amycolatopsis sp. 195334CR]|uniref:cache domain-containing protein n=1 Tax=Amycolatopsis sp. 195334CR TaxID=2814588 RepID=UPI001A904860|nr:cache domain-containing protein [Amycolatopsis sp. 195334CR]MBN6041041.1 PDC sensor domain-containing protein [Amycolatopsis sp. 195334CR]